VTNPQPTAVERPGRSLDDPAAGRDLLAGEAIRIAGAVPALVLVAHDPGAPGSTPTEKLFNLQA